MSGVSNFYFIYYEIVTLLQYLHTSVVILIILIILLGWKYILRSIFFHFADFKYYMPCMNDVKDMFYIRKNVGDKNDNFLVI